MSPTDVADDVNGMSPSCCLNGVLLPRREPPIHGFQSLIAGPRKPGDHLRGERNEHTVGALAVRLMVMIDACTVKALSVPAVSHGRH